MPSIYVESKDVLVRWLADPIQWRGGCLRLTDSGNVHGPSDGASFVKLPYIRVGCLDSFLGSRTEVFLVRILRLWWGLQGTKMSR